MCHKLQKEKLFTNFLAFKSSKVKTLHPFIREFSWELQYFLKMFLALISFAAMRSKEEGDFKLRGVVIKITPSNYHYDI